MKVIVFMLSLCFAGAVYAQELGPGDYSYLHEEYHKWGSIDELRAKTNSQCCDGMGECRATYVDMRTKKAYVDGRWCPLPENSNLIRADVSLPPNGYALVCAGQSMDLYPACPKVYCVALPENQ